MYTQSIFKTPKDASYVTLRNQNRMLYANFKIQENKVQNGCQLRVELQNGGPADADIIPKLLEGARETTVTERDLLLANSACQIPAPAPRPVFGGSMLFNNGFGSTGTQVTYPNDSSLAIGQESFTIEWFQYWTSDTNFPRPFSIGSYENGDIDIAVSFEGGILFWNGTSPIFTTNSNPPLNTWTHIAIVGTGGTNLSLYVNGIEEYSANNNYNFTDSTTALAIGNETDPSAIASFAGSITNFRWVKGTAVYSGASFTVPSQPLTDIPGTQLLLLASNETDVLKDSSAANRTPTNTGVAYSTTTPF